MSRTTLLTVLAERFLFAFPDQFVHDAGPRNTIGCEHFLDGFDRLREGLKVNPVFVFAQDQVPSPALMPSLCRSSAGIMTRPAASTRTRVKSAGCRLSISVYVLSKLSYKHIMPESEWHVKQDTSGRNNSPSTFSPSQLPLPGRASFANDEIHELIPLQRIRIILKSVNMQSIHTERLCVISERG